MCQLTFMNFSTGKYNRLYIVNQWWQNRGTMNKDGFGTYCNGKVWKSAIDVANVINFGTCLLTPITGDPTIAHIRAATTWTNVKTVDDSSSHPFETEKLVLAHNGSLEYKDPANKSRFPGFKVDSEVFLQELSAAYDGTNFVEAIQKAMDLFNGPFAFLIYSKLEDRYFAVKGDTKKLHSTVARIFLGNEEVDRSILINTDKLDLEIGIQHFKAIVELESGGSLKVTADAVTELEKNSIFELNVDLDVITRIGDIKETAKVYTQNFTGNQTYQGWNRPAQNSGGNTTTATNSAANSFTTEENLVWFLENLNLTIAEFDAMMVEVYGHGFLYAAETEVLEMMEASYSVLSGNHTTGKSSIWAKICEFYGNPIEIYAFNASLKFPYMLNSEKALNSVYTKLVSAEGGTL